jgi:hypothetical protein
MASTFIGGQEGPVHRPVGLHGVEIGEWEHREGFSLDAGVGDRGKAG